MAGPLALSFDKKVAFYKNWLFLIPAIGFMMLLFIPWDVFFTFLGVWSFNPNYISGIHIFNLPLEEVLFFITIPYACVFIYECLNAYFPNKFVIKKPKYIAYCMLGFSLLIYIFYFDLLYTGYTAIIAAFIALIQVLHKPSLSYLGNFYRAFIVSFIPMLLVDGILTGKPIVQYNPLEKSNFDIGSIPWEDFHYNLIMLYMVISFYEFAKNKWGNKKAASSDAASS